MEANEQLRTITPVQQKLRCELAEGEGKNKLIHAVTSPNTWELEDTVGGNLEESGTRN